MFLERLALPALEVEQVVRLDPGPEVTAIRFEGADLRLAPGAGRIERLGGGGAP